MLLLIQVAIQRYNGIFPGKTVDFIVNCAILSQCSQTNIITPN